MSTDRRPSVVLLTISPELASATALALHLGLPAVRADGASRQLVEEIGDLRNALVGVARAVRNGQERSFLGNARAEQDTDGDVMAVSVREASRRLGLSERTVRRQVAADTIKTTLVGRRRLVAVSEIERFLDRPE